MREIPDSFADIYDMKQKLIKGILTICILLGTIAIWRLSRESNRNVSKKPKHETIEAKTDSLKAKVQDQSIDIKIAQAHNEILTSDLECSQPIDLFESASIKEFNDFVENKPSALSKLLNCLPKNYFPQSDVISEPLIQCVKQEKQLDHKSLETCRKLVGLSRLLFLADSIEAKNLHITQLKEVELAAIYLKHFIGQTKNKASLQLMKKVSDELAARNPDSLMALKSQALAGGLELNNETSQQGQKNKLSSMLEITSTALAIDPNDTELAYAYFSILSQTETPEAYFQNIEAYLQQHELSQGAYLAKARQEYELGLVEQSVNTLAILKQLQNAQQATQTEQILNSIKNNEQASFPPANITINLDTFLD